MKNKMKEALKSGKYLLGGFLSIGHPAITEAVALAGLDFVIIDTEHGDPNFESVINMIRASEARGITAVVRQTSLDPKMIGRYLDNGAYGIQVPMIETAEEAKIAVEACKYAPMGTRGASGGRGAWWGAMPTPQALANQETLTVCMCETDLGVKNIDAIAKTPNLDVIFVGTGDLAQSMNAKPGSPELEAAVATALKACKDNGVIPGIVTASVAEAKKRIEQGFTYVTCLNDMRLMYSTVKELTTNIRA